MKNKVNSIKKSRAIQKILFVAVLSIMITLLTYEASSAADKTEVQKLSAFGGCVDFLDGFGTSISMDSETIAVGAPGNHTVNLVGSVYILQWNGSAWDEGQKLTASDGSPGDRFGKSISLQVDTLVAGSAGAAYIFVRDGTGWTEQQKLTPLDGGYDAFGTTVSLNSNTLVVSDPTAVYIFKKERSQWVEKQKIAPGGIGLVGDENTIFVGNKEDSNDNGDKAGTVFVFTWNGAMWVAQQTLTASDGSSGNGFGRSMAMEGNTILVGSSTGNGFEGAVYVFNWDGSSWVEVQKIIALYSVSGSGYTDFSMALQGTKMVVGAEYYGDDGQGAAYVFGWDGVAWSQEKILRPSDMAKYDHFGSSLAIYGDTIMVGAPQPFVKVDDFVHIGNGKAYLFQRETSSWIQNDTFFPACQAPSHYFGSALAVDGDTLVVGGDDGSNEGKAWIFKKNESTWVPQQTLKASDPLQTQIKGDQFGGTLAIDGDTIVIGSIQAEAAYVFKWDRMSWNEQQKLTSPGYHGEALAIDGSTIVLGGIYAGGTYVFKWNGTIWAQQTKLNMSGGDVAIDGNTIAAGDVWDTTNNNDWAGAIYVYQWDGSAWVEQAKLTASDGGYHHRFGAAIDIDGDTIITAISPYGDARAVYIFKLQDASWIEQKNLTGFDGIVFDYNRPAISIDSDTVLVGADGSEASNIPGSAYAFHGNGNELFRLIASDGSIGDSFGKSAVVEGKTLIIGADGQDSESLSDAGAVYIFDLSEDNSIPFDLTDAVLMLRMLSENPQIQPISKIKDITADGKIGLHETIYILQEISQAFY